MKPGIRTIYTYEATDDEGAAIVRCSVVYDHQAKQWIVYDTDTGIDIGYAESRAKATAIAKAERRKYL